MSRIFHLCLLVIILLILFGVSKFNSKERDFDTRRTSQIMSKKAQSYLSGKKPSWWIEEQLSRLYHVSSTCQKMKNFRSLSELVKNRKPLSNIIVDDIHKTLYCYIPKVACGNWKRVFLILTGRTKATDPKDISGLEAHFNSLPKLGGKSYTTSDIRWRLETYTKFMFVRDPLERLVSGFRNKLLGSKPQFKGLPDHILKHYKRDGEDSSNVTFSQFMRYIINTKLRHHVNFNEHWRAMHHLCHPCAIQYDFIGKYETLNEDADHILEQMKVPKKVVQFPPFNASFTKSLQSFYTDPLTPSEQEDFIKIYETDYKLFGYNIPNIRNITIK